MNTQQRMLFDPTKVCCFAGLVAPPPEAYTAMINGGMRPYEVTKAFTTSFYKVVAILGVLLAVGFTAFAKIGSILLRAAGL